MKLRVAFPLAGALLALAADTSVPPTRLEAGSDPLAAPRFLPVDEAFAFSTRRAGERFIARWEMPPGYYLYRHRFDIQGGEGVVLGSVDIPAGKPIVDDYFGESEVYYRDVEISAPVLERPAGELEVSVRYQGCADYGLCYPPQTRNVALRWTEDEAA